MPRYEFECPTCGRVVDVVRSIDDRDAPAICITCYKRSDGDWDEIQSMKRLVTKPAVHLKGKGWTRGQRTLK